MAAILIIEDDEPLAWAEARLLREAGHTPVVAPNARTALRGASDRPDLILLDLGLPDAPGEDLLRRLKSRPETARIPVLVITGLPEAAERLRATGEGKVIDVLLKPFASARLCELVEAALGDQAPNELDGDSRARHHHEELVRRLLVEGSDALVFHVYRRMRADRVRAKGPQASEALSWTEIADWARHEGLLDPAQASLLRRLRTAGPQGHRTARA